MPSTDSLRPQPKPGESIVVIITTGAAGEQAAPAASAATSSSPHLTASSKDVTGGQGEGRDRDRDRGGTLHLTASSEDVAELQTCPTSSEIWTQAASSASYGVLIRLVPAFGQEVGWRGYVGPKLEALLGFRASCALTALLWALWTAPLTVSVGYQYGAGYPNASLIALGSQLLLCLVTGTYYYHLTRWYVRSEWWLKLPSCTRKCGGGDAFIDSNTILSLSLSLSPSLALSLQCQRFGASGHPGPRHVAGDV